MSQFKKNAVALANINMKTFENIEKKKETIIEYLSFEELKKCMIINEKAKVNIDFKTTLTKMFLIERIYKKEVENKINIMANNIE